MLSLACLTALGEGDYRILHHFAGGANDGATPWGSVVQSGTTLYGMTSAGGSRNKGVIFALDVAPKLAISRDTTNVNVSWNTNFPDFGLESTDQLAGAWTPVAGVIGDSASLPTDAERQFFRLNTATATAASSFVKTGQQLNRLAGRGVALADLNGDGFLDAFVVNEKGPDGEGHRVCFGDGQGRFTDSGQRQANLSNWAGKPVIGDVNGDGKLDAITGNTIWVNDGKGHFEAHPEWIETSGADFSGPIEHADLDGDGYPDLVAVSGWKSLGVYLNDGQGHFRDSGQILKQ